MRPREVARNIQQAKSELERLKNEMSFLSAADDSLMDDYAGVMHYSIGKFQQSVGINQPKSQQRQPLPHIGGTRSRSRASIRSRDDKQNQVPPDRAYKRLRRAIRVGHSSQVHSGDSTLIDNEKPSFSIINRPVRILSFAEKNVRQEYQTNIPQVGYRLHFPASTSQLNPKDYEPNEDSQEPQQTLKLYNVRLQNQKTEESRSRVSATDKGDRPSEVETIQQFQFELKYGKVDIETVEFGSFRRIYESVWKRLKVLFERLEELLNKHKIQRALADGKRMTVLALRPTATLEDLVSCLIDNHQYKSILLPRSAFVGVQNKLLAILKIQRYWRMYTIRKQYISFRQSVVKAQRFLKKFVNKIRTRRLIHERNDRLHQSFLKRQGQLAGQWDLLQSTHRFQLHINSFAVDEIKRITVENIVEKKNLQLTRIFRLSDPTLSIIMVLPVELPTEVLNYYYRVLELSGVPGYRDRLYFLVPEASRFFPSHMSTTKLLYYSPKCMDKVRRIVKLRSCVMISSYPCNQSIKVCQLLNIPLLSGDPQKAKYFSTKSQARRLFAGADLPVPPGAVELYDLAQFTNTLAVLIANNRHVHTWLIKIDDEFNGRGIATLNVHKIKAIRRLLAQKQYEEPEEPASELFPTVVPIEEQADFHEQLTTEIKAVLEVQLPRRLVIACPNLYKNYTEYMSRLVAKGGNIEAYPVLRSEDIKSCSVTFFTSPAGETRIVCSYDKIVSGVVPIGCSFPQTGLTANTLQNTCKGLSDALQLRGMFGYFTVDFIAFKEAKEKYYRSWAIGLDCYLNTNTCSFFYFDMLVSGKYLLDEGQYLADRPISGDEKITAKVQGTGQIENTLAQLPQTALCERTYLFIPYIHHEYLNTLKMKTFFKMARLEGISFDLQEKQGVCMLLVDQLCSGVLGLMAISSNLEQSIDTLYRALLFIGRQAKAPILKYGSSETESRSDEVPFRDIVSKLTTLHKKYGRQNFLKEAAKRNLIHCNLEEVA